MTGPFTALACIVEDSTGDAVARCYRRSDAIQIAADLNLADSVIAAIGIRHQGGRVVKFDLSRIADETLDPRLGQFKTRTEILDGAE